MRPPRLQTCVPLCRPHPWAAASIGLRLQGREDGAHEGWPRLCQHIEAENRPLPKVTTHRCPLLASHLVVGVLLTRRASPQVRQHQPAASGRALHRGSGLPRHEGRPPLFSSYPASYRLLGYWRCPTWLASASGGLSG